MRKEVLLSLVRACLKKAFYGEKVHEKKNCKHNSFCITFVWHCHFPVPALAVKFVHTAAYYQQAVFW
jgi:hypothetical protein